MNKISEKIKNRWRFWFFLALALLIARSAWLLTRPYTIIERGRLKATNTLVYNIDGTRMAGIRHWKNDYRQDEIVVWKTNNRHKEIYSLAIQDKITSLLFIRHDTIAFIHYDDFEGQNPYSLTVVNIETGDTFSNHDLAYEQFSLSADHKYLFTVSKGDESSIQIWDTETWKIINSIPFSQELGYSMPVISPTQPIVAMVVDVYPYQINLWNFESGESIGSLMESTSSNHNSKVFQSVLQTSPPYYADVEEINFSPDGKLFVSCGPNHGFKLWDIETMQMIRNFGGSGNTCFFHPSGKYLVFQYLGGEIGFIDIQNGEEIIEPLSIIRFPKFSIFEIGTIPFLPFAAFNYLAHPDEYNIFISATLSPDEKTLTIGSDYGFGIYLYDLTRILPPEYFEE